MTSTISLSPTRSTTFDGSLPARVGVNPPPPPDPAGSAGTALWIRIWAPGAAGDTDTVVPPPQTIMVTITVHPTVNTNNPAAITLNPDESVKTPGNGAGVGADAVAQRLVRVALVRALPARAHLRGVAHYCANEGDITSRRHFLTPNRKILQRPRRLRPAVLIGRHRNRPHTIRFQTGRFDMIHIYLYYQFG